jgi:hypothetical protein
MVIVPFQMHGVNGTHNLTLSTVILRKKNIGVVFLSYALTLLILACTSITGYCQESLEEGVEPRIARNIDFNWLFKSGDQTGAEHPLFDDRNWRSLNVPHDWGGEGAFDLNNPAGCRKNQVNTYRRRFKTRSRDIYCRMTS